MEWLLIKTFMTYFLCFLSYGFGYGLRPKAEVCQCRTFGYGRRWKLRLRSNTGKKTTEKSGTSTGLRVSQIRPWAWHDPPRVNHKYWSKWYYGTSKQILCKQNRLPCSILTITTNMQDAFEAVNKVPESDHEAPKVASKKETFSFSFVTPGSVTRIIRSLKNTKAALSQKLAKQIPRWTTIASLLKTNPIEHHV